MRKLVAVGFAGCVALSVARPAHAQDILLDWNSAGPAPAGYWAVQEIGWYYTPTQSFWVSFLGTRFGSYGTDRNVIAEIRTAPGADGGVTLASGVFNSSVARTGIGGAFFTSFLMEAGTEYFLGFRGMHLLGANAVTPGVDGPNEWRVGYTTGGMYSYHAIGNYRPVLRLGGTFAATQTEEDPPVEDPPVEEVPVISPQDDVVNQGIATPEPISIVLIGTGLAGIGAIRRRRKSSAETL